MGKRYALTINVRIDNVTDVDSAEASAEETVYMVGTLEDLQALINSNSCGNTARQMAVRLITAERRGEYPD